MNDFFGEPLVTGWYWYSGNDETDLHYPVYINVHPDGVQTATLDGRARSITMLANLNLFPAIMPTAKPAEIIKHTVRLHTDVELYDDRDLTPDALAKLLRDVWKHGFDAEHHDDIDYCNKITIVQSQEISDYQYLRDSGVDVLIEALGVDVDGDAAEPYLLVEFLKDFTEKVVRKYKIHWDNELDESGYVLPEPPNPAVAAIEYALKNDEPEVFLKCWMHGEFQELRDEWENIPDDVFIGAEVGYEPKEPK